MATKTKKRVPAWVAEEMKKTKLRRARAAVYLDSAMQIDDGQHAFCCFAIADEDLEAGFHAVYLDEPALLNRWGTPAYFTSHAIRGSINCRPEQVVSQVREARERDRDHRVVALCLMAQLALDPDQDEFFTGRVES